MHPYDATGADPTARLTIDLGAGDRYLTSLAQYATLNWLSTSNPVLDYAIAMVPSRQPSASTAEANWQEHLADEPQDAPPVLPLAPAKLAVSLFIDEQKSVLPECNDFAASLQNSTSSCQGGVGTGAIDLGVPIPMPALRQS